MWNKKDTASNVQPSSATPHSAQSTPQRSTKTKRSGGSTAVIGPSISIKGDLSGKEDLIIEGRVEGEVRLHKHSVTVGRSGRVSADVFGESIQVEGEVHGNLTGESEVVIRNTGRVEGNIVAPRVTLEDGSSFRGTIDMQGPQESRQREARRNPNNQKPQLSSKQRSQSSASTEKPTEAPA